MDEREEKKVMDDWEKDIREAIKQYDRPGLVVYEQDKKYLTLIDSLRVVREDWENAAHLARLAMHNFADEYGKLRADYNELREAVEPFVAYCNTYDESFDSRMGVASYSEQGSVTKITLGDLRALKQAYEKGER